MTDEEVRNVGRQFMDRRRGFLCSHPELILQPTELQRALAAWDFVDLYRLGLYVLAKNESAWSANDSHILSVCRNPSAFAEHRSKKTSARCEEFKNAVPPEHEPFLTGERLQQLIDSGESCLLDGEFYDPSAGIPIPRDGQAD